MKEAEAVMREGSYQTGSQTVRYTDADTFSLASDLYQFIDHDYKGSDSIDAIRLEEILKDLRAGKPLEASEWDILDDVLKRVEPGFTQWREGGRDGQGAAVPQGSGRIEEALSLLPAGELTRIREQYATASTTKKDRDITAPHLHDGTLHDMAHALQHAKRLQDKDVLASPESVDFNVEHVLNHLESGIDHASRLGKHLEEHPSNPKIWQDEKAQLHQMREDAPKPPPGLRDANSDTYCCRTCKMFWTPDGAGMGKCTGYANYEVRPDQVCNAWYPGELMRPLDITMDLSESGFDLVAWAQMPRVQVYRMREDTKPTVAIDFDGVIYDRSKEPGGGNLSGSLIKGTEQGLAVLAKDFRIVVLTARPNPPAVRGYLEDHGLGQYIADVTNTKPSASAYVDNRSLLFKNWPQIVKDLDKGNSSPFESNIPGGRT